MVMNKRTKECLVSIWKTKKRFLSILIIVLLGVGFYSGIRATSPDMQNSLNNYFKNTNFYDLLFSSNYGITKEQLSTLKEKGYQVEGSKSFDTVIKKKEEYAVKILSYDKNSSINKLNLKKGRLPQKDNECVIEKNNLTKEYNIGDYILVSDENLSQKKLKITGIVTSPLYISKDKESTKLLSGTIDFYLYTPLNNFTSEIYNLVYIDLAIKDNIFSDTYWKNIKKNKKGLKELVSTFDSPLYQKLQEEATSKLNSAKELYQESKDNSELILNNENISTKTKDQIKEDLNQTKEQIKMLEEALTLLEEPKWYVYDIKANIGYNQYEKDTERITNVAKVFPLVFFIVAILICLTTMTRMVEEERLQIGTLKSLGYNDKDIMFKYILYALLATIIGSIVGSIIGFSIIPPIIFNMYKMMYTLNNFSSTIYFSLIFKGTALAIICTLGATVSTCRKTLKEVPAELLLPKSPKPGKRVLLEKIPFIWQHLSFSKKVTVRNLFRYKKRALMTIIGIAGCTGLILAGFGLKDCITQMVPKQYENIFDYQVSIQLKENTSLADKNSTYNEIIKMKEVKKSLKIQEESLKLNNINTNQNITLMIPLTNEKDFIKLQNRKTGKKYTLNDGVIVTEKLAKLLNIKVGDTLDFTANKKYKLKVAAITENYLFHYIYMNKTNYQSESFNTILLKTDSTNSKEEKEFAKKIRKISSISAISFNSSTRNIFASTMKNFGYVSLVLIVSAGLLALVVLYNLASVNISERKREISSIKVLGFYNYEVYNYLSRETVILTIVGMFLGLGLGKILTNFIIKTCEIDMLMFNTTISLSSYCYALIITVFFTIIVNILVYITLKKIDMIESLKSVE